MSSAKDTVKVTTKVIESRCAIDVSLLLGYLALMACVVTMYSMIYYVAKTSPRFRVEDSPCRQQYAKCRQQTIHNETREPHLQGTTK